MKRNLWIWIAAAGLALLLLPGCNSMGKTVTGLAKALAHDPATVRLTYGPLVFERFVPATNAPPLDLGAILAAAIQLGRFTAPAAPGIPAAPGVADRQIFFQPQSIPLTSLPLMATNILFVPLAPPK